MLLLSAIVQSYNLGNVTYHLYFHLWVWHPHTQWHDYNSSTWEPVHIYDWSHHSRVTSLWFVTLLTIFGKKHPLGKLNSQRHSLNVYHQNYFKIWSRCQNLPLMTEQHMTEIPLPIVVISQPLNQPLWIFPSICWGSD